MICDLTCDAGPPVCPPSAVLAPLHRSCCSTHGYLSPTGWTHPAEPTITNNSWCSLRHFCVLRRCSGWVFIFGGTSFRGAKSPPFGPSKGGAHYNFFKIVVKYFLYMNIQGDSWKLTFFMLLLLII